jgi:DNA polymerase-3 subunit delta'
MYTEQDLPWLAEPLRALRDQTRGHALILHGGAGSGLLELAWRAAQSWLCENPPGPCGHCASCHLTAARSHPDLKVLMPEAVQVELKWAAGEGAEGDTSDGESKSKRKPSREVRVEQVRQAIDWAHTSSSRGQAKVLLVFPADAMNAVSANALLKTIEEPAPGMKILLCVGDPEQLLPTIRSRCQRVRLAPPAPSQALAWLQAQGVQDAAVLLAATAGEPLSAARMASEGLTAAVWSALPQQLRQGDVRVLTAMPVPLALRTLQQICHDAMALAAHGAPRFFPLASLGRAGHMAALVAWHEALQRAARHDEHPWHAALLIDSLAGQGRQALSWQGGPVGGPDPSKRLATLRT